MLDKIRELAKKFK